MDLSGTGTHLSLRESYRAYRLHGTRDNRYSRTAVQHGTRDEKVNQNSCLTRRTRHSKLVAVWPAGVHPRPGHTHRAQTTQSHRSTETPLSLGETISTRIIHARLVVAVVLVAMLVCACTAGIASSDASAQGHAHAHVVRPSCQSTQLPPLSIFSTSSAMSSAW